MRPSVRDFFNKKNDEICLMLDLAEISQFINALETAMGGGGGVIIESFARQAKRIEWQYFIGKLFLQMGIIWILT